MKIEHVILPPNAGDIRQLLERFPILHQFPLAQAGLGDAVRVLVRSDRHSSWESGGVQFQTFPASNRLQALRAARSELRASAPDVVHFHGTIPNNCLLASWLRLEGLGATLAMQDQVTLLPRGAKRAVLRAGLAACDAVFFAARALADPLVEAGLLEAGRVQRMPGGSTDLVPLAREEARRRTGLSGEPLYLWAARLAEVKNPMLAARAMARLLRENPRARFALVYREAPLLEAVRAELAGVSEQVTWLGEVPPARMGEVFSSADVFLLTSKREGYCYALVEALACGVSPVVSAIPANLEAIGGVGESFPPGDLEALSAALRRPARPRAEVRQHFEARLTYRAMAEDARRGYLAARGRFAQNDRASAQSFNRLAADYDRHMDTPGDAWVRSGFHAFVAERVPRQATLLDFGCGTGTDARHYAAQGHRVLAYDNAPGMIEQLRAKCGDLVERQQVVPWTCPWPDFAASLRERPAFEAVTANFAVANLVPDLAAWFAALRAALPSGGRVLISVLNPWYWGDLRRPGWWSKALPGLGRQGIEFGEGEVAHRRYWTRALDGASVGFRRRSRASAGALMRYGRGPRQWDAPRRLGERLERSYWQTLPLDRVGRFLFFEFEKWA